MALGITPFLSHAAVPARQHRLPNFFVVGAAKAGTTSLYEYLKATSGVYMPPVKEPAYFSPAIPEDFGDKVSDLDGYLDLFREIDGEHAVGEATPFYLWDPESPRLIREAVPEAKVIIMLRDPVERAFSDYLMLSVYYDFEPLSFTEALQANARQQESRWGARLYLELGEYSKQVQRYLDVFGTSKVKVILFEDFKTDTRGTVNEVLKFLNVPETHSMEISEVHNPFSVPKTRLAQQIISNEALRRLAQRFVPKPARDLVIHKLLFKRTPKPQMPESARAFLQEYYREDVSILRAMLNRELPWQWADG